MDKRRRRILALSMVMLLGLTAYLAIKATPEDRLAFLKQYKLHGERRVVGDMKHPGIASTGTWRVLYFGHQGGNIVRSMTSPFGQPMVTEGRILSSPGEPPVSQILIYRNADGSPDIFVETQIWPISGTTTDIWIREEDDWTRLKRRLARMLGMH